MVDPLAEVVTLLQPKVQFAKRSSAAGKWSVDRADPSKPFYCLILEGQSRLVVDQGEPILLEKGDFVLVASATRSKMSSVEVPPGHRDSPHVVLADGEFRLGDPDAPPSVRMLVGHCVFGSPDASLLVTLLPKLILVRNEQRLSTLVQLVGDEARHHRPARDVVLARLLEVVLIEALRSTTGTAASPGLVKGLADERLATALRSMHESPKKGWTVLQLAKESGMSRSAFFERFSRAVGMSPIEYLLSWRMALAKDLLRRKPIGIAEVAERVGYSSASTFSVAFTRHEGQPPAHYAREYYEPG